MAKFDVLTTDELIEYCKKYKWKKPASAKEIHVHHTWLPSKKHFKGNNYLAMQKGMENSHKQRGFSGIAQHLTLFPDGKWGLGRDFNEIPASIKGWNRRCFIMFEMIGDFDKGKDKLEGEQLEAVMRFCAFLIEFAGLDYDSCIKFHRDNPTAGKSCPGTGITKEWFYGQLDKYRGDEQVDKVSIVCDGKTMEGIKWNDSSYLTVREVAKLLGKKVQWDAKTQTVTFI